MPLNLILLMFALNTIKLYNVVSFGLPEIFTSLATAATMITAGKP